MAYLTIEDSDKNEQRIFGKAVIGIAINSDQYLAKIVSRKKSDVAKIVSATIKYFIDSYPNELQQALNKYRGIIKVKNDLGDL